MQARGRPARLAPADVLNDAYESLLKELGPQRWWPARTRLEVILGAILTQNTSWSNVRLALRRLRIRGLTRWTGLRRASPAQLENCVRPAGFYRQKARTIRIFVDWIERAQSGSLHRFFGQPQDEARRQLLELKGFGPETADAILLYAGRSAFFVADAYTRRILSRHGLIPSRATYAEAQSFIHRHLESDQAIYNEFHALLVEAGKLYCRPSSPRCSECPLEHLLEKKPAMVDSSSERSEIARRLPILSAPVA